MLVRWVKKNELDLFLKLGSKLLVADILPMFYWRITLKTSAQILKMRSCDFLLEADFLCLSYWPRVYNTLQDIQIRYVLYKKLTLVLLIGSMRNQKTLTNLQESAEIWRYLGLSSWAGNKNYIRAQMHLSRIKNSPTKNP